MKKHTVWHIIADTLRWGPPALNWNFSKEGKLGYFKKITKNKNGKNVHVSFVSVGLIFGSYL